MDLSQMNGAEQAQMTRMIEKKQASRPPPTTSGTHSSISLLRDPGFRVDCELMTQMQDFMKLYSGLVERCFMACTNDFTSKALTNNENCTDKFLKHSERIGARFAEHNAEQMQK